MTKESLAALKRRTIQTQVKSNKVPNDPYESGKLEAEVIKDIQDFCKHYGFEAIRIYTGGVLHTKGGVGHMGSNEAEGKFDFEIFLQNFGKLIPVEAKRNEGGKISPAQQRWVWIYQACNIEHYVVTSAKMLEEIFKQKGYINGN